ncbi:SUN domain-containing ossification factor [Polymixia lowei]
MRTMMTLIWRIVSVWLFVALVCWHPSCHVGCTKQHPEAQRPPPTQDIGSEEEPGDKTHHHELEESWVSHIQSPPEDEQQKVGGDGQAEEEPATQRLDEKEHDAEALEVEELVAEVMLEPEAGMPELVPQPEPNPEPDLENQLPEASITQDQESASTSEPPPPSSDPTEPEDISGILTSQDHTINSVSDDDVPEVPAPERSDADLPPADCEAGEPNPYDSTSPPVVLENTSNVHSAGTKTQPDPSLSPQADHGAQHLGANTSHALKEQGLSSPVATETDTSTGSKDPEDIPTFDEWKRKMMEVEKEKTQATHTSTNGGSHPVKKVQKNFNNYASVECGAKILGANTEAKSTSAILKENMDLYMLNPCSNKIWFVIELCEPIQLKQLDIANFELFSSTPKDFLVSISDRYPTNKWLKLGTFHARDERTVQSFPLDEHLYAKYVKMFTKYIKVELVSHFGSEHFCPLSLIRVFGTSMVEEYEEIADPSERADDQDDDLDYPPGYTPGEVKSSNNLIGSAKDVILNMVNNIAVNVLGGSPEMQGNLSSQEFNMTESSSEHDATTKTTTTTNPPPVPVAEEVETLPDPDAPAAEADSPEPPVPETPTADPAEPELPPVEENIVTPLQEEEEEPIGATITLLDKDEDMEEERENKEQLKRQNESLDYCALFPSLPSSPGSSSSCSCSASLQEHLHQQCSVLLSKRRKCQTLEKEPTIPPRIQTPAWQLPPSPSACPEPQQPHVETQQSREKEHVPGQGETGAGPAEAPQPLGDLTEAQEGSSSEPPLLEPSQTSNLPQVGTAESSAAKPTPAVEPARLSNKDLPEELRPEKSQDVEEKHKEPTAISSSTSASASTRPSGSVLLDQLLVPPTEEKPNTDVYLPDIYIPVLTPDAMDQSQAAQPTTSPSAEEQPAPPTALEIVSTTPDVSHPAPNTVPEPEPSDGHAVATDTKMEDLMEDIIFTSSNGNGQSPHPSSPTSLPSSTSSSSSSPTPNSEFFAELPNGVEQGNGNQVHGTSQKESVFMRLNNRIKALEMNMSLSGRYLEQLSQRYRKQMEEMQRAFNKTIIKLQNTSKIAEEQDQRQTESIQTLQGQLENVTQLVLNLSVRVSLLQSEVSDRQSYLLLSLLLCLLLGLLLFANHCRISAAPSTTEPEPPAPKSYSYCCPERHFLSCEDTGLNRSASYPLLRSESFQLPTIQGNEETQGLFPENRKKRRSKMKAIEEVETLKPSSCSAAELANGAVACNGLPLAAPLAANRQSPMRRLLHPAFRDSPSEGSSEGSSHSDDPSFCGIATACTRICEGLPAPRTRAEKRALRRRRPKPGCAVVDLLQAPQRDRGGSLPGSSLQDLMSRRKEQSSGTFGGKALSGPV